MSAPLVVNTRDGACWTRRSVTEGGIALYALADVCQFPEFVMATLDELAARGIAGSADVLPMPAGPEPQPAAGTSYPPALPWARLMDDEDLSDFLDELADAAGTPGSYEGALATVENAIATWRVIGEAQHAHNTAPGPNAGAGDGS